MAQSLEELALFECLPPGMLEKYALQFLDRLDDDFVKRNYLKLLKKLNDKAGGYTVMLEVEYIDMNITNRKLVSEHVQYEDVAKLLFQLIDKSDDNWSALDWSYLGLLGGENQFYVDKYYDLEYDDISKNNQLFTNALNSLQTAYSNGTLVDNICGRSGRGDVGCPYIHFKDGTVSVRLTASKTADRCGLSAGRGSMISIIDIDEIFKVIDIF